MPIETSLSAAPRMRHSWHRTHNASQVVQLACARVNGWHAGPEHERHHVTTTPSAALQVNYRPRSDWNRRRGRRCLTGQSWVLHTGTTATPATEASPCWHWRRHQLCNRPGKIAVLRKSTPPALAKETLPWALADVCRPPHQEQHRAEKWPQTVTRSDIALGRTVGWPLCCVWLQRETALATASERKGQARDKRRTHGA